MSLHYKYKKGFTLVELVVSVSIMVVIIAVVVKNQSNYTSGIVFKNVVNNLALDIRQAQVYGTSVKDSGSNDFSNAFGLSIASVVSVLPVSGGGVVYVYSGNSYNLFIDKSTKDGRFNGSASCPSGDVECVSRIVLPSGYGFELCVILTSGVESCSGVSEVNITFLRPSTVARLYVVKSPGGVVDPTTISGVRLKIHSPSTASVRSVVVYTTGQISVQ